MSITKGILPREVITALWSYDPAKLDPVRHRKLIIGSVLNYGTKPATDWLFTYYGSTTVKRIAQEIPRGAWDRRSLALWSLVLGINPKTRLEIIDAH